jgi:hypothetical protein
MRDAKPEPRIKDPALMRLLKIELDECEISGVTTRLNLHHVLLKSAGGGQRGDDVRANIICINEDLHTRYHHGDEEARRIIGRHIDNNRPDVACYIAEKLGSPDALLEWFARHGIEERRAA